MRPRTTRARTAAVAGTDYTAVSTTTLTFMAGDTVKTVTVATAEDDLNEADETFTVALSGVTLPAGVSLGDAEAVGTITDDDGLTVSVAGPGANVEEGQTATFTVTVTGNEHDGGGGELRGGHHGVDGDLGHRLHGPERDGADDWRWSGERDDPDRDGHGRGAGAG